jgi:hypothetical protein
MFEDFENRMGFWKDLGSNFTINYSGLAPSFLTSGEMWESMDSGTTQTLAAWENGWVLTNNPDGTITANPKYTSGLPSETLVKVPVGPQSPSTSPATGIGGVAIDSSAVFKSEELLDGWKRDGKWTLQSISTGYCLEAGGNASDDAPETCTGSPFTMFTIRGTEGTARDDNRWWWKGSSGNILGLSNYNTDGKNSGGCEIDIREGYQVRLKIIVEARGFGENGTAEFWTNGILAAKNSGVSPRIEEAVEVANTAGEDGMQYEITVLMTGGDKLSVDIDSDWGGINEFTLVVGGITILDTDYNPDDEVIIELLDVYTKEDTEYEDDGTPCLGACDCATMHREGHANSQNCEGCIDGYEENQYGVCVEKTEEEEEWYENTTTQILAGLGVLVLLVMVKG